MITKPLQHDIDYAGGRILRDALEPFGWVLNGVERDYGIDYCVQVFDGVSPNGMWFHIQLKSHQTPDYSADQTFISESIESAHVRHFAIELEQPLFIVVADVRAKRLYWYCPQLDRDLIQRFDAGSLPDELTVRIPTANHLPGTADQLLIALRICNNVLANRRLVRASANDFSESVKYSGDPEAILTALQDKGDALRLEKIAVLYRDGKYTEARQLTNVLLLDPGASVQAKFWASIDEYSIGFREIFSSGRPQEQIAAHHLKHAHSLMQLTSHGPKPFKFFAIVTKRAAELEILVYENFRLGLLSKAHSRRGGNPMLALNIYARRAWLEKAINKKYNQCLRLAQYAAKSPDPWLLGRALTEITNALSVYLGTLRVEGQAETAAAYAKSALQIIKLAGWISARTGDVNGLAMNIIGALVTVDSEETDTYKWAVEAAEAILDPQVRGGVFESINNSRRRWRGEKVDDDIEGDSVWQAIQNMASVHGMDISDENAPLVKALRIAVRDDTPDRALKECEHMIVTYGAVGPNALIINELFNMKTACSKVVHCKLHNFHVEGRDLDSAYTEFERTHCLSCSDRKPRPESWKFIDLPTPEDAEYLVTLIGTPYDMRIVDDD